MAGPAGDRKGVADALRFGDGERYRLIDWVIMPNHIHTLIETRDGHPSAAVVHGWKSCAANQANRRPRRRGPFWVRDYFDRCIRDDRHLAAVIAYIENNPVKAGLVDWAENWTFGSARRPAGLSVAG